MKPERRVALNQLFTLIVLTFLLVSCKKQVINEVKINDLAALTAEFAAPSREYTTAPFFVWNYRITKEEIDRYMNDFRNSGSHQVFVHPRPGLITEYLSEEWFDLFRYTVEKGKELGMDVWIYDENSYPSGFAGGHVPDQMPESFNQGQGLKMTRVEILPDTVEKYFLCLRDDNGTFTDITSSVAGEKGKQGQYLLFSKTFNGKSDWYGGFSYVDLLYPGVTQKFLEITMPGYEKSVGSEFGKSVPGIFTDEPQISAPGGIRWTPDLFDVFREEWHYDLVTCLPSLYEEVGDWKKVRHNYTQTLLQLFIDRWAKPYYQYCEEKGLKFTGHYWEHEWPNMRNGGDNMAMYAWHQLPAIDMLFNQWDDSTSRAQFGNVRAVKELASAANQTGRQRKLSETYGGAGWELTFTDMKRLGDWEYALGVNLMNQHLSHFTLAGARKYDYPLSFTYHQPWWNNYKYLNDHFARLSLALSSGRQVNDILILEPTTSAWLYDSYVKRNPKLNEIGQSFQSFITKLEKSQTEFDLGSENIIRDLGSVDDNTFTVGECNYTTVVIPPMMENLDIETFKLLAKFVKKGGTLLAFSIPKLINGSSHEGLSGFFRENTENIHFLNNLSDEVINKYFRSGPVSFTEINGGDLYHHRRVLSDGQIIFLANSSLTKPASGTLRAAGADAIELNTFTGKISGFPNSAEKDAVSVTWELPPAGSLLLFIPSEKKTGYETQSPALNHFDVSPASSLIITKDEPNAMPVEFCDLTLGGEIYKDLHTYDAADKVYKFHGFKNGNPWNTSVQYKTRTTDRDTFGIITGFKATYYFTIAGIFDLSSMKAVIERPSLWKISVNGSEVKAVEEEWWLDREFGVVKIGSLVKRGINSITLDAFPMNIHAELEPVYITGDFSVIAAEKGWTVGPPAASLNTGSWKEQGLPFYSWGIKYAREYSIDTLRGNYIVSLQEWNGTVAEVNVNGEPAGLIAFPPFQTDVTPFIRSGTNTIVVNVKGSLKNLLGPHFNNPKPGLVSPGHFRNVKSYPSGKDYQLIDYGMIEDFRLLNSY